MTLTMTRDEYRRKFRDDWERGFRSRFPGHALPEMPDLFADSENEWRAGYLDGFEGLSRQPIPDTGPWKPAYDSGFDAGAQQRGAN